MTIPQNLLEVFKVIVITETRVVSRCGEKGRSRAKIVKDVEEVQERLPLRRVAPTEVTDRDTNYQW